VVELLRRLQCSFEVPCRVDVGVRLLSLIGRLGRVSPRALAIAGGHEVVGQHTGVRGAHARVALERLARRAVQPSTCPVRQPVVRDVAHEPAAEPVSLLAVALDEPSELRPRRGVEREGLGA
jgi:hypothetical protein